MYWSDDDTPHYEEPATDALQALASLWSAQVESFDSLPKKSWPRKYVKFSPSQADACDRQLYYVNTNAPQDDGPVVAWKERRRRNGDAYHAETQKAHGRMVKDLRAAGVDVNFEIIAFETNGAETYRVELDGKTYDVRIEGRCDVLARYVGETIPGVIKRGDVVIVDYKAKAKMSGVSGIKSRGVPSYVSDQMTAYSLLTFKTADDVYRDINVAIVHFESLEKMKETEEASKDVYSVAVHATDDDKRRLLVKFARVVKAIDEGNVPDGQFDRCAFCTYKGVCAAQEAKKAKEGA